MKWYNHRHNHEELEFNRDESTPYHAPVKFLTAIYEIIGET